MRASLGIGMGAMLIGAPAPAQKADAPLAALAPFPNGCEIQKDELHALASVKIAVATEGGFQ